MATAPTAEGANTKKTVTKATGGGTKAKKPARRKKPTTKSTSASNNQATWSAARAAQMELAGQRSSAAARLSDPLWYRVEDVLHTSTEETAMAESPKILPEQVQIVEAALKHNHLTRADVTPQAFCVLLEQARRFALELLADAQDYAVCAGRTTEILKADLQLASDMRPDHPISVTTQLPKLNLLAQQVNRLPLPPIPTQCYSGVLLPPKHHQLTARTFDVVSGAQVAQKMVQPTPSPYKNKKTAAKPSYGAARGRQISIQLKEPEKKEEPGGNIGSAPMDVSSTAVAAAATAASATAAARVATTADTAADAATSAVAAAAAVPSTTPGAVPSTTTAVPPPAADGAAPVAPVASTPGVAPPSSPSAPSKPL
jgi:hypothetical protein